jgi:hypothetical protein
MSYGKLVFDFVRPTFETSPCTHNRNDFVVVDQQTFKNTAVPGATYILHIRELGTSLVVLGAFDQSEYMSAVLRQADPKTCEIYLVTVRESSCAIKEVSAQEAILLAGARPKIEVRYAKDPFNVAPTLYQFFRNDELVGSATISVRYDRGTNRTQAHVGASIPSTSDRLTQMHVSLLIERACTKEAGSLFWGFGHYTVNEMPFEDWVEKLTACTVPIRTTLDR